MIRQGAVLASAAYSTRESSSDAVMRTAFGHSLSTSSDPAPSTVKIWLPPLVKLSAPVPVYLRTQVPPKGPRATNLISKAPSHFVAN